MPRYFSITLRVAVLSIVGVSVVEQSSHGDFSKQAWSA